MFSPEEFLSLEHTAHAKLFENQKYVWDPLKQIASYLKFRLKPAVLGRLVGKPFISDAVFIGEGTMVEQGAVIKGRRGSARTATSAAAVTCARM